LSGERAVLQIYRRRDHPGDPVRKGPDHGVFIKSIVLKEIWPSDKIAENTAAWNDEFPPLGVPGSSVVAQVHECRYMTACEPLRNSREIASWVIHHWFNWNRCRHVANISVNRRPS
jgi:hypothetical protein